jgi:hypothetical protein
MPPADDRHAARAAVARWRTLSSQPDVAKPAGRRVLIAASYTANPMAPALGVTLADTEPGRNPPSLRFADHNQIFQLCLQPDAHGADDSASDDVLVLWRIEDVFERDFHAWASATPGA